MESPRRSVSPEYTFDKEDDRPIVIDYKSTNQYRPGEIVYFRVSGTTQLEGPYKIEAYAGVRQYTLCFSDGKPARNGEIVVESDLTQQSTE